MLVPLRQSFVRVLYGCWPRWWPQGGLRDCVLHDAKGENWEVWGGVIIYLLMRNPLNVTLFRYISFSRLFPRNLEFKFLPIWGGIQGTKSRPEWKLTVVGADRCRSHFYMSTFDNDLATSDLPKISHTPRFIIFCGNFACLYMALSIIFDAMLCTTQKHNKWTFPKPGNTAFHRAFMREAFFSPTWTSVMRCW